MFRAKKNKAKKSRLSRVISAFSAIFTLTILIGICSAFAIGYYYASGPSKQSNIVLIERGQGLPVIATKLKEQGIVSSSWHFVLAARLSGKSGQLKAGEFEFPAETSLKNAVDILVDGKTVQRFITFPEGMTSLQIVRKINEHPDLVGEIEEVPSEGILLPETYDIPLGTSRQQLIERMNEAMQKAVEKVWQNRADNLPVKTPYELLILASIVEKETGIGAERPLVASVFINRLNQGIKLQSDPTIIYGLVGGEGRLGRGIKKSEIRKPTEYNTYTIPALPPTPIANPGLVTLEATANPAESNYIFFVADGTGGHVFAETYKEHQENVRKWRQIEQERNN